MRSAPGLGCGSACPSWIPRPRGGWWPSPGQLRELPDTVTWARWRGHDRGGRAAPAGRTGRAVGRVRPADRGPGRRPRRGAAAGGAPSRRPGVAADEQAGHDQLPAPVPDARRDGRAGRLAEPGAGGHPGGRAGPADVPGRAGATAAARRAGGPKRSSSWPAAPSTAETCRAGERTGRLIITAPLEGLGRPGAAPEARPAPGAVSTSPRSPVSCSSQVAPTTRRTPAAGASPQRLAPAGPRPRLRIHRL